MNLTNAIRDEIISDVITKTFEKEEAALKKTEHKIGMALYNKLYPAKERELAKQLGKEWVRQDSCLRISVMGMDMRFVVNEPVPVRGGDSYCARLGIVADTDLQEQALKLENDKSSIKERSSKLRGQLKSVLYGVNTYKRLCETWPEGNKFYSRYKPKGEKSLLPQIRVNELNETLGLIK